MTDSVWWKRGVIYQMYPRSFQDTNGDGVGDLKGIAERLDYLKWLGVDAIWISPIYPSPMADFGYDVSDYCNIDPLFGSLDEFDRLVEAAHARDIKVILDFVPNHTSSQHPWFLQSSLSRTSPRRDWYIWRDGKPNGLPPNNWLSQFGGSAWTLDRLTGQYYLHSFLHEQPDLNWRNPAVRAAMYDVLRFWLARGVDGFRVDVIWLLIKDGRPARNARGDRRDAKGARSIRRARPDRRMPNCATTRPIRIIGRMSLAFTGFFLFTACSKPYGPPLITGTTGLSLLVKPPFGSVDHCIGVRQHVRSGNDRLSPIANSSP